MMNWKPEICGGGRWCDMGIYVGGSKTTSRNWPAWNFALAAAASDFRRQFHRDLMVEDDEHLEKVIAFRPPAHRFHSEMSIACKPARRCSSPAILTPRTWNGAMRNSRFWHAAADGACAEDRAASAYPGMSRPAQELEYLKGYRDICTCEMLVNHLTQVAPDCYERLGARGDETRRSADNGTWTPGVASDQ